MLIDAHCHLDRYRENLAYALEQIKQYRIFTMSNSMDLPSYKQNVKIATTSDLILPVFGIHPWNASEYVGCLNDLDWAITESPMLGEIGLDYYFVSETSRYDQRKVFEHFLKAVSRPKENCHRTHQRRRKRDLSAFEEVQYGPCSYPLVLRPVACS
jgi:TatD DNase family protein